MKKIIKQLEKKGYRLQVIMNPFEYKYIVSSDFHNLTMRFKTLKGIKDYYQL